MLNGAHHVFFVSTDRNAKLFGSVSVRLAFKATWNQICPWPFGKNFQRGDGRAQTLARFDSVTGVEVVGGVPFDIKLDMVV